MNKKPKFLLNRVRICLLRSTAKYLSDLLASKPHIKNTLHVTDNFNKRSKCLSCNTATLDFIKID